MIAEAASSLELNIPQTSTIASFRTTLTLHLFLVNRRKLADIGAGYTNSFRSITS